MFEEILDSIQKSEAVLGEPKDGDLILFQVDGKWVAGIHPLLSQRFNADNYDDIQSQALEYAVDKSERGIVISVWKKGDFNTGKHILVL